MGSLWTKVYTRTHIADVRYKLKCNGKSVQWYLHNDGGTWKHLQLETSNRLLEAA